MSVRIYNQSSARAHKQHMLYLDYSYIQL